MKTILIVSQVYAPDPSGGAQHIASAAAELASRGHRVIVLTADRGYEDPSIVFSRREMIEGVDVRRLPRSSFGKRSLGIRALGWTAFVFQAVLASFRIRDIDVCLVATSPPMGPLAGWLISLFRGATLKYWVLDMNPDQAIELGVIKPGSIPARVLGAMHRLALRRASDVVALDRFMAQRVNAHLDVSEKLTVIPQWPIDPISELVPHDENPFRREHGLEGKFVIMYSGNHAYSNPLTTIVEAAKRLTDLRDVVFLFIGGGAGMREIKEAEGGNIRTLPFQPKAGLKYSLPAADVHIVSIGDRMVGIIHPSKAYSALAAARPLLLLGPEQCHITEILDDGKVGWRISHGDIDGAERLLRSIVATDRQTLAEMGARARALAQGPLSREVLRARVCDIFERTPGDDARRRRSGA